MKRSFFYVVLVFFLSGCVGEPEVNPFTQLRQDMQKHREKMFAHSVENMKKQRDTSYQRRKRPSVVDPEIELKRQQEEERKRWLDVGIDMEEAQDWKALNLTPKNAARWKKTGLSYTTISVMLKKDVTPAEAVAFINQTFDERPNAFAAFAKPLYRFEGDCDKVLKENYKSLDIVNEICAEYIGFAQKALTSGYLADEFEDTDLSLEYIAKLRQMDSQKHYISKLMLQHSQEAMIQQKPSQFALLFPMIEKSPTKEEMFFISKHKLDLKNTDRYRSYQYYEFWVNKEKEEEAARIRAIKQQKALRLAKLARQKAEAHRMKALAHNKMVEYECGPVVTSHPTTGEKVHVEGLVQNFVGKQGTNIFSFVVRNKKDGKSYLVRDPEGKLKINRGDMVSWSAITVGRVVSVTLDEDGTGSYNHYEDESKEYLPLLKFSKECPYTTKSLRL